MTRLFLDTNVFLDLLIPGREGKEAARCIIDMQAASANSIRLYLSALTVSDISYVLRKHFDKQQLRSIIKDLFESCNILPVGDMTVHDALRSDCPDFEDALQISCAEAAGCDFLLTSNLRHFSGNTWMTVMSPALFIAKLQQS